MGQFKPMVKMETTEPSVILKLKKGGHVNMKKGGKAEAGHKKMAMGGGAMDMMMGTPALVGRPAVNAPVRAPGKPSMAMRRKAMMAKPAITPSGPSEAMPPMKKGGKAEGGKSDMAQDKAMIKKAFKQHDSQEHKGGKGTDLKLKKGGMKKMATGGVALGNAGGFKKGGMATGGVKMGNAGGYKKGGYASGGNIPSESISGTPATTIVDTAKPDRASSGTSGVRNGNAGGFKSGGKTSKKAYATGGTVNSGRAVAMPQGTKPAPAPVAISRLAGTYKGGGKVAPGDRKLQNVFNSENAQAMRESKTQSNMKYGSPKRMAGGGRASGEGAVTDRERKMMDELYFDKNKVDPKSVSDRASRELEEALNPLSMMKELYGKARNAVRGEGSVSDKERETMEMLSPMREKGQGAVTKTEKSITVSPAGKKRGGRAC